MIINKRTKYKSNINKNKKPTKKYMSLMGKTAFDVFTSSVGKSVWNKKYIKTSDGIKTCTYIRSKCYDPECSGFLEYDKRGFKHCNVCGLGSTEIFLSRIPPIKRIKNQHYSQFDVIIEESISDRNNCHKFGRFKYVDFYSPYFEKLNAANNRILAFEKLVANGKEAKPLASTNQSSEAETD